MIRMVPAGLHGCTPPGLGRACWCLPKSKVPGYLAVEAAEELQEASVRGPCSGHMLCMLGVFMQLQLLPRPRCCLYADLKSCCHALPIRDCEVVHRLPVANDSRNSRAEDACRPPALLHDDKSQVTGQPESSMCWP